MEKYGFAVSAFDDLTFVNCGIVIRNLSPDEDALDVTTVVNVIGSGGEILKTETDYYAGIPAASTYYASCLVLIFQGFAPVSRIEVSVSFDERQRKALTLPAVSNVRIQESSLGEAEVVGEVQNTSARPLSEFASITAVAFDAAGNVIGGGWDSPDADLPPGGRIGFAVDIFSRRVSEVASAQVSVEPDYE